MQQCAGACSRTAGFLRADLDMFGQEDRHRRRLVLCDKVVITVYAGDWDLCKVHPTRGPSSLSSPIAPFAAIHMETQHAPLQRPMLCARACAACQLSCAVAGCHVIYDCRLSSKEDDVGFVCWGCMACSFCPSVEG